MKAIFIFAMAALTSIANAQSTNTSSTTTEGSGILSKIKPILTFKSYNTSGRNSDLRDRDKNPAARTFQSKDEIAIGAKTTSGDWGGYVQFSQKTSAYNNTQRNKWSVNGDTSLSVLHPAWMDQPSYKLSGMARQYFPVSDASKDKGIYQSAYYLTLTANVGEGRSLFNQAIPRYFKQSAAYAANDTRFYVEDRTTVSQKLASWAKLGVGQWSQYEQHGSTPDAYCTEVFPYMDFNVNKNILISPRVYLPVMVKNQVYDGPQNATTDFAYAELYFEMAL